MTAPAIGPLPVHHSRTPGLPLATPQASQPPAPAIGLSIVVPVYRGAATIGQLVDNGYIKQKITKKKNRKTVNKINNKR